MVLSKLKLQIEKQARVYGISNISIISTSAQKIHCTGNTLNSGQLEKFFVELTTTGRVKAWSLKFDYRNEFVSNNND